MLLLRDSDLFFCCSAMLWDIVNMGMVEAGSLWVSAAKRVVLV